MFLLIAILNVCSPSKRRIQNELLSPKKDEKHEGQTVLMSPRKVVVSPIKSPSKVTSIRITGVEQVC